MRKAYAIFIVALVALTASTVASAREKTTFTALLTAAEEIPGCPQGVASGAEGLARIKVDAETGEIKYHVFATNLPGTIAGAPGAHIHVVQEGGIGPVVLGLELTGHESGLVASGKATDPVLAAAILADPSNYYVNVHTTTCPGGAIRGQLA
jgi:CHRD domain-containing protein